MKTIKKFLFFVKTARIYINYKLLNRYPFIADTFGFWNIPFLIIINPTLECNLRCTHCINWKTSIKDRISVEKLYNIIDEIHKIGIPFISFSGGEPLLIPSIEKAAHYAKKKNIYVNLNTNGTLINNKNAQAIVNSFDSIRIGLNGFEKMHDSVCGVKGTYKKIQKNIKLLKSIPKRSAKIGVNYIINKENLNLIQEFNEFIKKKVDFINYLPEFSFDHMYKSDFSFLKSIKSNQNSIFNKNQLKINLKKEKGLNHLKKDCDAGKLYIILEPTGEIFACPFIPYGNIKYFKMGSIYKTEINTILKNSKQKSYSNKCYGCNATCTTQISSIFKMPFYTLFKNFYHLNKLYNL